MISTVRFMMVGTQTSRGFLKSLRTDQLKVRDVSALGSWATEQTAREHTGEHHTET